MILVILVKGYSKGSQKSPTHASCSGVYIRASDSSDMLDGANEQPLGESSPMHNTDETIQASPSAHNVIESAVDKLPSELMGNEALSILKSIETEVKASRADVKQQGKIMNAFIASQREFNSQLTREMSEIKELFKTENAR